ncbi:MAG: phosphate/phosphite/phosphonate ABC transporter substrate-binding protein [Alphaproteobacteria bacterium]|nr:MAG: phosphate/phosphite/phosphonate ABC transporter substrate-binding protein [Alphaproteobacteria bacterium]
MPGHVRTTRDDTRMKIVQPTRHALVTALILLTAIFGRWGGASAFAGDGSTDFVIGRISPIEDRTRHDLQAMSHYLAANLKGGDKMAFREIVVPTVDEMVALLKAGRVDMVSETPLAAMALEQVGGARVILREWKKGVPEYAALMISRRGAGIESFDDLKGRVLAFEDPGSTSGFLVPLAYLRRHGLELVELADRGARPPAGKVGYVFATHEINIASLVARGIVDAGAISDMNWTDAAEVPPGIRDRLQVFFTSEPVIRSLVLVGGGMDETLQRELTALLISMNESLEGRAAMITYHGVHQFDAIDAPLEAQLAGLRQLYGLVADRVH